VGYSIFLRPDLELLMGFSLEGFYSRPVRVSPLLTCRTPGAVQAADRGVQHHDKANNCGQQISLHTAIIISDGEMSRLLPTFSVVPAAPEH
jgi:hypothetical protein